MRTLLLSLLMLCCWFALPASALEYQAIDIRAKDLPEQADGLVFLVEVARTSEEQAQGLMKREVLPEGTGMLFPFDPPQETSFWMKDTLLPLDIIFVGVDEKILRIAENTTPGSLDPIPSGGKVLSVLEIGGGEAKRLGIKVGDSLKPLKKYKTPYPAM